MFVTSRSRLAASGSQGPRGAGGTCPDGRVWAGEAPRAPDSPPHSRTPPRGQTPTCDRIRT